jgi:hypothetical protein
MIFSEKSSISFAHCYQQKAYEMPVWHPRTFDLLVDGNHLATETLHVNKAGEFFEMSYLIPPTLTSGRRRVVVRFQLRPADIAGGVFAPRMMRN